MSPSPCQAHVQPGQHLSLGAWCTTALTTALAQEGPMFLSPSDPTEKPLEGLWHGFRI